ncbi:MAG: biopolymer transport protein ExbB [Phycisphaerales bacterium]|jgi:biopolymer transport protein ExbB
MRSRIQVIIVVAALTVLAGVSFSQGPGAGGPGAGVAGGVGEVGGAGDSTTVWSLFWRSFDLFSIVLIAGSLAAVTLITKVILEVREPLMAPPESTERVRKILATKPGVQALRGAMKDDDTFVPRVLAAALEQSDRGRDAMREAAEIEASIQAAKWFRKIEILNVIGNLGPLVGLAGTVWGMIIAFNTLGTHGGEAGPAELSGGIAKALFHTLLGLLLAIPCLLTFGLYRGMIDRVCNRAMADAASLLEKLPTGERADAAPKGKKG